MSLLFPDNRQGLPELRDFIAISILMIAITSCAEPSENKTSESESTKTVVTTIDNKEQSIADILAQAEQKYSEAKTLEHAWKATRAQIVIAHEALKENDQEKAKDAATRALFTANASLKQAQRGKEDWLTHVVK